MASILRTARELGAKQREWVAAVARLRASTCSEAEDPRVYVHDRASCPACRTRHGFTLLVRRVTRERRRLLNQLAMETA